MLRKSPLRAKPKHKPIAAKRHHDFIASLGCLVCGAPAEVHHVTAYADRPGRFARDHWLVAPLCPNHHRAGCDSASMPVSVEMLGHQGFYQEHGIDLYAEAMRLADISQRRAA